MVPRHQWLLRTVGLLLLTLYACSSQPPGLREAQVARSLPPLHIDFTDDFDRASLQLALQRSLHYLRQLPPHRIMPLGHRQITVAALLDTLEAFQLLLQQAPSIDALNSALQDQFEWVQASGRQGKGDVLFTGYYEASLSGSLVPTADYTYPLYIRPADMVTIDLARFRPEWTGERLMARYNDGHVLPYFTRQDIDTNGKLRGRQLELVWLSDAVDGFFLHIQGSGRIRLPDGQVMQVNYAESNGHPYRSIGKLLLDEGDIPPETLSMQRLRHYLRANPVEQTRIFNHNPRYIFFRQVDRGPIGSLGLTLVAGRSVAMDPRVFPPAGLAFIQTQQPILSPDHQVIGWKPMTRVVFNHDTGNAITGPGRVDVFWGNGALAEASAGHLKHEGRMVFLLKLRCTANCPKIEP